MQTDVLSAHITGSGVLYAAPTRLKGVILLGAATAGDVVFYDNASAASGTELLRFAVPNNANNVVDITLPGEGIRAKNGLYVTTPTGVSVTAIYG